MNINELISPDVNESVNSRPMTVGGMRNDAFFASVNQGGNLPELHPLLQGPLAPLWYEGELCCLYAPTNTGKTILAMQIAMELAQTQLVQYFDFEMSPRQLYKRYKGANISPMLYRAEIDPDTYNGGDLSIDSIGQIITGTNAKIAIIDNLTYLCCNAEKGADAGSLMKQLCNLKMSIEGLSMLIIAHTPKRPRTAPITDNDLAGSRRLLNFFDSAFAINASTLNNKRYLKQIKSRVGEFVYNDDSVLTMSLTDYDGLKFEFGETTTESSLLVEVTDADRQQQINDAIQLARQGLTCRDIATRLGKSAMTISRWIKKEAK